MVEDGDSTSKNVSADIVVHAAPRDVWHVLTDYDQLASIVPNLAQCHRVQGSKPGSTLLYQKGFCQTVFWRLEAAAVLEVTHTQGTSNGGRRELQFQMVSGDFQVRS